MGNPTNIGPIGDEAGPVTRDAIESIVRSIKDLQLGIAPVIRNGRVYVQVSDVRGAVPSTVNVFGRDGLQNQGGSLLDSDVTLVWDSNYNFNFTPTNLVTISGSATPVFLVWGQTTLSGNTGIDGFLGIGTPWSSGAQLTVKGGAITPPDIEGLQGWWRPEELEEDFANKQFLDIDTVGKTQWRDSSGNGRHLITNTSGSVGVGQQVLFDTLNGYASLRFGTGSSPSSNDARMNLSGSTISLGTTGYTILMVHSLTSGFQTDDSAFFGSTEGTDETMKVDTEAPSFFQMESIAGTAEYSGDSLFTMGYTNSLGAWDGSYFVTAFYQLADTRLGMRKDGVAHDTGGDLQPNAFTVNRFGYGTNPSAGCRHMSFSEMLIYDRKLTHAELLSIEGYLNSKYALNDGEQTSNNLVELYDVGGVLQFRVAGDGDTTISGNLYVQKNIFGAVISGTTGQYTDVTEGGVTLATKYAASGYHYTAGSGLISPSEQYHLGIGSGLYLQDDLVGVDASLVQDSGNYALVNQLKLGEVHRAYIPAGETLTLQDREQILVYGEYEIDDGAELDLGPDGELVVLSDNNSSGLWQVSGNYITGAQAEANYLRLDTTNDPITGDLHIADGQGFVVGHTAQVDFGATPEFQILGTEVPDSSMGFATFKNGASEAPDVRFLKSRGATLGSNVLVQDGDRLGRIRFQGADGNDFNTTAAEMQVEVDGAASLNNVFGRFIWRTRSAGGLNEKMRLTAAGNLGIGTTAPDSALDVHGTVTISGTDNTNALLIQNSDGGTHQLIVKPRFGTMHLALGSINPTNQILGVDAAGGNQPCIVAISLHANSVPLQVSHTTLSSAHIRSASGQSLRFGIGGVNNVHTELSTSGMGVSGILNAAILSYDNQDTDDRYKSALQLTALISTMTSGQLVSFDGTEFKAVDPV